MFPVPGRQIRPQLRALTVCVWPQFYGVISFLWCMFDLWSLTDSGCGGRFVLTEGGLGTSLAFSSPSGRWHFGNSKLVSSPRPPLCPFNFTLTHLDGSRRAWCPAVISPNLHWSPLRGSVLMELLNPSAQSRAKDWFLHWHYITEPNLPCFREMCPLTRMCRSDLAEDSVSRAKSPYCNGYNETCQPLNVTRRRWE